jgi:hypothetical protein
MANTVSAMDDHQMIDWLLQGDVSIQYQVYRDLLRQERPDLQDRIATEGWGARFLSFRNPAGHWGQRFYQPKWISTHYTLLDLKNLAISPANKEIKESIAQVLHELKAPDGGILPIGTVKKSDVCVNGMFLNYASYFRAQEELLRSIVDFLLVEHMPDGGFNCHSNRKGAVHSSLHSTISVLEGILEYSRQGYSYRRDELQSAAASGRSFLLQHKLFRSDRTGEIIHPKMLMLSYPSRWYYDILRALEYLRSARSAYDPRLQDALEVLMEKRRKDNTWPVQAKHPGQVHFDMEKTGGPSRWNTLRALRVLEHFTLTGWQLHAG